MLYMIKVFAWSVRNVNLNKSNHKCAPNLKNIHSTCTSKTNLRYTPREAVEINVYQQRKEKLWNSLIIQENTLHTL